MGRRQTGSFVTALVLSLGAVVVSPAATSHAASSGTVLGSGVNGSLDGVSADSAFGCLGRR